MGAFYGSIHVRSEDVERLRAILHELARAGSTRFLAAPVTNGWIAVFPSESGQDFAVSAAIAARVDGSVIHLVLHDDDVFAYTLYDAGGTIDEYSSNPDYFSEVSADERERTKGRPETLAALSSLDAAVFAAVLDRRPKDKLFRAQWQLERVASLLGLSNAATSYEYLQAGERQGIRNWQGFAHVPDGSTEKEAARRKRAETAALEKDLQSRDVMLVRQAQKAGLGAGRPIFCAHPGDGFLFAWSHAMGLGDPEPLWWWRAPWKVAIDTGLRLARRSFRMCCAESGRRLAVVGDHIHLFDLDERRPLAVLPTPRPLTGALAFSADERLLYVEAAREIVCVETEAPFGVHSILKPAGTFALHPTGSHLLAVLQEGNRSAVVVFDLEARRRIVTLSTAQHVIPSFDRLTQGKVASAYYAQEVPGKVGFSPDGSSLIAVVPQGLRLYRWTDILEATRSLPAAYAGADTGLVEHKQAWHQQTYDFVWQKRKPPEILFSGLDGCVHAMEVASGISRILLEVPGTSPVVNLSVASDGLTLATASYPGMWSREPRPAAPVWRVWNLEAVPVEREI